MLLVLDAMQEFEEYSLFAECVGNLTSWCLVVEHLLAEDDLHSTMLKSGSHLTTTDCGGKGLRRRAFGEKFPLIGVISACDKLICFSWPLVAFFPT